MTQIILASQSPARVELLKKIGIENIIISPADIDETAQKQEKPNHLALRLSQEKCTKIAQNYSNNEIIIAADTVVALGVRILPKALSDDDVRYCLNLLSGRRHRIYTGVTIIKADQIRSKIAETIVRFKSLTKNEIEEYIKTQEGLNKAGGYSILGSIQACVPFISGQTSTIVGLPLFETKNMLLSLGYKF